MRLSFRTRGPLRVWKVCLVLLPLGLDSSCGSPQVELTSVSAASTQEADFERARLAMVESQIQARGVSDSRVLEVMRRVPRHEFVPPEYRAEAYSDTPIPIGLGQTISQPYIVALMTELLQLAPGDQVLEVGTGSGYQAAVAAELVAEVYSIEIIPELARTAASRLEGVGYVNVSVRAGDGYLGWPDASPFDGILVAAGAEEIPQSLVDQLKPGARMIIPVGDQASFQVLQVVEKRTNGGIDLTETIPVRFVPLLRD